MALPKELSDFAPIEEHIRRANAMRSAYIGVAIANAVAAVHRWLFPDPRRASRRAVPMVKRFAPHR